MIDPHIRPERASVLKGRIAGLNGGVNCSNPMDSNSTFALPTLVNS
jgi:hypothetical protein